MESQDRSRSRSRSRSPPRSKSKKSGTFKWKGKRPRDTDPQADQRAGGQLERGYRNRSPLPSRRQDEDTRPESYRRPSPPGSRDKYRESQYQPDSQDEVARKRKEESSDKEALPKDPTAKQALVDEGSKDRKKRKSKDTKPKPVTSSEPMIIVHINDRLGTKAAIPCLASDSIKAFKAIVAAHIGRRPHEILIKRQGERPMKDILTLEDYNVSNGVQLDLELDTGD